MAMELAEPTMNGSGSDRDTLYMLGGQGARSDSRMS